MPPADIPPKLAAANAAFAQGRPNDAIDLIMSALEENPALPAKVYRILIVNLVRSKRLTEAEIWVGRGLQNTSQDIDLLYFSALIFRMTGRLPEALAVLDALLSFSPEHRDALFNKGHILNELRNGPAAEAIFRRLIANNPDNGDLYRALGKSLWVQTRHAEAAEALRTALVLAPASVDAWLDLSALEADTVGAERAITILDEAIEQAPDEARLYEAKAIMFRRAGRADRLELFLDGLRARFGNCGWFQNELGQYAARFDRQAANDHFRRAIDLDPDNIDYQFSLISNLVRTRAVDEGAYLDEAHDLLSRVPVGSLRKFSKVAAETYLQCADAEALRVLGSIDELGRYWAANDQHTALLFQFARVQSDEDRREVVAQHRSWGERMEARAARNPIVRFPRSRSSAKSRIGFMSSDLREHPVSYFSWPLLADVHRDRFEIYCYSWFRAAEPSPFQQKIASMVDCFRWHPFITDRDAAQMIADDDLDILFELGGSTHMNKLEVMAWKPAPLCVSWLGYPHSAGLSTIDYLLVDPYLSPPDPALLIEQPLVMPRSWFVMSDRAFPDSLRIKPIAPIGRNGFVTFGTANNPYKYNPPLLRTWAKITARLPDSRFLFLRPEAGSKVFQRNILTYFAAEGVEANRIEFRAIRGSHMPHYNDIDIALDTFPQTGGTTTCEALWMGVPTVTLVGEAMFERLSYSILSNAGLGDLCASTIDQFIDIAVALAADADRLLDLRSGLREQIKSGPLGQTRQFADDFYDLIARTVRGGSGAAAKD